jgi:ADP-dependent NAD(P)H-hydrate dehydratase / NAD(P)H-hydrate epimerase
VPSGLNANTGAAFQPTIEADETITFIADKPGLHTADGVDHAGAVTVMEIGVPNSNSSSSSSLQLLTHEVALPLIPNRRANSHKGRYGNVGIVGGAEGMTGAAVLAARAALHMGPGKVYLGLFDKDRPALDLLHPEIMVRDAKLLCKDENITAFAIGMGMGETGAASLLGLLTLDKPLVIDADALNAISVNPSIRASIEAKKAENARPCLPFIFTPHPGEAANLLNLKTADVQEDRFNAARLLAQQFHAVIVLKGAGTIIAHPDGRMMINTTGNAGMASGGMGDALSGMLAAFIAIGLDVWDAACLGVYLHGAAGDAALHHGMGPHGLTASEVIFEARSLLNGGLDDGHDD